MVLQYNGICIFKNEYIEKDRFIKCEDKIFMHPYPIAAIMLSEFKKTYFDVFNSIGVDNHSIDACCDYAMKKLICK